MITMAPKYSQRAKNVSQEHSPSEEEESASDVEFGGFQHEAQIAEKDEDEIELEKVLFGDSAGFRDSLRFFERPKLTEVAQDQLVEVTGESEGLDHINDADVRY